MSLYLVIGLILAAFSLGGTVVKVLDNDKQREELKEFLIEEVNGLRGDWNRRYYDDVNKRLEKLEENDN